MELKEKDAQAAIGVREQLLATLRWTSAADFDLAAIYEERSGKHGLVYFGEPGALDAFPYMELSGDAAGDEAGGASQETLRIARIDGLRAIWLLCWDYGKVQDGEPAPFRDGGIRLTLTAGNSRIDVSPVDDPGGNVIVLAALDNIEPAGARLVNIGKVGTLKGLTKLEHLLEIIRR